MSVRIIGAVCVVAALAGCAKSSDEPPEVSPNTLASQGYDAYNRGEYRDAVTYFEDALAAEPDNAFAMQGLAASRDSVLYFGDRRPMSRDTSVERAVYRASLRGYEAYERGDLAEAGAQFRAVLEITPGDRYALRGLEVIRRRTAQRAGTVEAIAPAAATYSDITEVRTGEALPSAAPSYAAPAPDVQGDTAQDGAYLSVGSYDSYVASGGSAEPALAGN